MKYFALEESKEDFMLSLIASRLFHKHKILVDILTLQSLGNRVLNPKVLDKIEECIEYFRELEEHLEIIDNIYNPFGKLPLL